MSAPLFPERSYNALLRTTPAEFRQAYGADVFELFRDLYREAWNAKGWLAAVRVWLRSMTRLMVCSFAEHREENRRRRTSRTSPRRQPIKYDGKLPEPKGPRRLLDSLLQDIHYARRSFLKKPGFTLAAITILGAGIGATTTIFSVVDTIMLRPLPYPDPSELVSLGFGGIRPRNVRLWQENLNSYEALAAAWNYQVDLTGDGPPENLFASFVTPDLLPMFGATPHVGRMLMSDDYVGDFSAAVLGFSIWQRRWGGDPSILGRQIMLDGRSVTVVGIMGADFVAPEVVTGNRVDVWMPLDIEREDFQGWNILSAAARLDDRVGLMAAKSELDAFTANIAAEFPDDFVRRDGSIRYTGLLPLQVATFRSVAGPLAMLSGAVLGMLLIACANVANLLLAHGTSRAREFALRRALGAGGGRIVRQLLTESVCLSFLGGVLGITLAFLGVDALLRFGPSGIPRSADLAVDLRILTFALFASVGTGILFGMFPAVAAKRRDVSDALKDGSVTTTTTRGGNRIRSGLVVVEIALALVLLTGAGLFLRSLAALGKVDPGFVSEQLVTVPLRLGSAYTEADRRQFAEELFERVEALPGTKAVAAGLTVPFEYVGASKCCMWHEVSSSTAEVEPLPMVMAQAVTADYFKTLDAPVSYGREFGPSDRFGDGNIVIINERTARYFFGDADAVGRRLNIGGWGSFTIIGVVRGVHHWGIPQGIQFGVYVPYDNWGSFADRFRLLVRSDMELNTLAPRLKEAIWAIEPNVPVEAIIPMDLRVADSLAGQRFLSLLLGTFACVALVIACGGLYASMLYMVGQRRQEMGIRLAMGATGKRLVTLVLKSGITLTALGIVVGIAGSIATAQVFRGMIWGVPANDPTTLIGVSIIFAVVALSACLVPALRAARVDPLQTLRAE